MLYCGVIIIFLPQLNIIICIRGIAFDTEKFAVIILRKGDIN